VPFAGRSARRRCIWAGPGPDSGAGVSWWGRYCSGGDRRVCGTCCLRLVWSGRCSVAPEKRYTDGEDKVMVAEQGDPGGPL
jgi:hypothetical protein